MASKKVRLDRLLVERGHFDTRAKAQAAVMAGIVSVDGVRAEKAGTPCSPDAVLEVTGPSNPYVSRGGLKLERALDCFSIPVEGRTCLDVGASTGGFTDCLLQRGAEKVYAVDVGYGQLDWKLRQDRRVVAVERTNFRYAAPEDFPPVQLIVIDVSFISLRKILPAAAQFLEPGGDVVVLVKPQFEAGRRSVGKGGVVRDPGTHREVLLALVEAVADEGWRSVGLTHSPVKGARGNIEFLIWWKREEVPGRGVDEACIASVVARAHSEL